MSDEQDFEAVECVCGWIGHPHQQDADGGCPRCGESLEFGKPMDVYVALFRKLDHIEGWVRRSATGGSIK